MNYIFFVAVFVALSAIFHIKLNPDPSSRQRQAVVTTGDMQIRNVLREIANGIAAVIAAALIAAIAVWYVTLFQ